MNLYSAAIAALGRFAAHYRLPRVVEQKTYVFFLVPFDFSKNGDAKRAEVAQDLVKGHSHFDRAANSAPHEPLVLGRGEIGCGTETISDGDVDNEPELDSWLMWTWFLPNPLWKSKQRR
jgi:hypothetical protein